MQKKIVFTILALGFTLVFAGGALCEMSSANFSIPTSVVSGGGAPMTSTSFQTDSTMGQPSPLTDPADPPFSTNYDLYSGFWYTVAPEPVDACEGDFDGDGDLDGSDLATFAVSATEIALEDFATDFGRTDCPLLQ